MAWRRWEMWEDEVIRASYASLAETCRILPHRTKPSIEYRGQLLGVNRPTKPWTARDIQRLRQLREAGAMMPALMAAFPDRGPKAIEGQLYARRIALPKKTAKRTINPAVASIRHRARSRGVSLSDGGKLIGRSLLHNLTRDPRLVHLLKAAKVFGGEVRIVWEPLD